MKTFEWYRKLAIDAENMDDWEIAADYWQMAIDAYPHGTGMVRARDLQRMQDRKELCLLEAKA